MGQNEPLSDVETLYPMGGNGVRKTKVQTDIPWSIVRQNSLEKFTEKRKSDDAKCGDKPGAYSKREEWKHNIRKD
jgi:hypothetical protein